MITVNCTSLLANLIESELFGREKGAFTGANVRQIGRFEHADGGTIFLDDLERHHILQVLKTTGWRIEGKNGAARLLGLNPSTLRARRRKYGIRRE